MTGLSDIDAKQHRRISLVLYVQPPKPKWTGGRPGRTQQVTPDMAKAYRSKNTIAPLIEGVTYRYA